VGLNNSFSLLQELFTDLRRGSGAHVIAASGGLEYTEEGNGIHNGVFTYKVLEGLRGEADRDHDGVVTVSELRDYVEREVPKKTAGRQHPTARRENLDFDFALW
jgi:uncharacterized caspase-like protein